MWALLITLRKRASGLETSTYTDIFRSQKINWSKFLQNLDRNLLNICRRLKFNASAEEKIVMKLFLQKIVKGFCVWHQRTTGSNPVIGNFYRKLFFKWEVPGLYFYFRSFQANLTIFRTNKCKNFHTCAGIRTHDFQHMSLLP